MEIRGIVTTTVLILALITISTTTAAALSCDYGDICVNETGWWRDGGALNASTIPIQAAVDNANAGETICVKAGSYTENVNITTPHLTLAGEGAGVVTVTAASNSDHVFDVTADYVNISGFTATRTKYSGKAGIYLGINVDHCNISENNCSNNDYGIYLYESSNNTLANNTANSNIYGCGIYLRSSSNNTLTNNTATSNDYGIYLYESSNNTLTGNTMSGNMYNFGVYSYSLSEYTQNIDTSNIVDEKPIYYWVDQEDKQIPSDAGFVGVVNSINITVSDLTLTNNSHGVLFAYTENSRIENNTANSNSRYGIYLGFSSDNTLLNNTANSNYGEDGCGIYLMDSSNNTLTNNTANSNYGYMHGLGIYLMDSSNNTLTNNTANSNYGEGLSYGIHLYSSSNNTLANNTANSNGASMSGLGIYLMDSSNNTLTNNTANSNYGDYGCGIKLSGSSNNTLANNTANLNWGGEGCGCGIQLYSSSNNTLSNNNATSNGYGYGYGYGISIGSSSNYNTLTSNNASNNYYGIKLSGSSNNTLANNTASNGDYGCGIYLWSSSNNTLVNNTASNNGQHGIYLRSSSNNTLASNNCSNNTQWDIYIEGSDSTFTNNTLNGTTISFTYSGDVSLKGVGSPAADPAGQQTIGKFINATNQSTGTWLFLNFSYSDADVSGLDESDLAVWKHNGTMWLKDGWNGTRYLDTTGNVVGVNITSFSVFAPAAPEIAANYIPPDPTNLANTTGSYWVNYTWSAGTGGNATDSYNVSLNGTWTNETTDTFMNTLVGPSGWANITVFAFNASGTGTLSEGSVSDNVQAPAAPEQNYIPPDTTNLQNVTSNYWVNYTWSPGSGNVTDSYNVSLNGTWTNGTTDTFMNTPVGPSGWANITVFAYNASGTGTLSEGSVSDEVQAPAVTPPVIVITTPEPNGIYTVGMKLNFSATDDENGVASIAGNLTNSSGVSQDVDSGDEPDVGVYTLVVTATDNAGNTNESDPVFFVVYDPAGGRATGKGWFYPDVESTHPGGKADFKFTTSYKKDVSTGKLDFKDKDADIKLKGKSIDWLVISSVSAAQFQGTGTINGEGLYTFRVQAKDNGKPGAGNDHFDIKIWNGTDMADLYYEANNTTIADGDIKVRTE